MQQSSELWEDFSLVSKKMKRSLVMSLVFWPLISLRCSLSWWTISAGRTTTNEELEEMLEQGNPAVFTQGVSWWISFFQLRRSMTRCVINVRQQPNGWADLFQPTPVWNLSIKFHLISNFVVLYFVKILVNTLNGKVYPVDSISGGVGSLLIGVRFVCFRLLWKRNKLDKLWPISKPVTPTSWSWRTRSVNCTTCSWTWPCWWRIK